jgi:hypothetical protein
MVASQRTKQEWAQFMRRLADEHYPRAEKIVLVMDNLNTHTLAARYEVFPITEARRLCQRFEVHYTPKHASWLNMAEIELSALDRQCLSQRLASFEIAQRQIAAWTTRRNQQQVPLIGALLLPMCVSNSNAFTHQYKIDRVLSAYPNNAITC